MPSGLIRGSTPVFRRDHAQTIGCFGTPRVGEGSTDMALFRLPSSGPAALAPRGNGLLLRAPQMSDFLQWAHLREYSREYLTPWEPIWPSDDLTRSGFRRRLRHYAEDIAADRSYPFIVFRESDGAMIRGLSLANLRRGMGPAVLGCYNATARALQKRAKALTWGHPDDA